jgi:hypothetical protein
MTTLELLEYIAAERAALAGCYPLPSPLDCVRYALTELGEYEDAMLRAERTGDKRNHSKPHDARRELGQVGEMLGAAWVQKPAFFQCDEHDLDQAAQRIRINQVASMLMLIADSLQALAVRHSVVPMIVLWSFDVWIGLCTWHGWDAHALLVERYAQVREKHCQEAQP